MEGLVSILEKKMTMPERDFPVPVHVSTEKSHYNIVQCIMLQTGLQGWPLIRHWIHINSLALERRETSDIWHTLVGNKIVDHSDVVGALPVGTAPTTSSFST